MLYILLFILATVTVLFPGKKAAAVFSWIVEFKERPKSDTLHHVLTLILFLTDEYGFLCIG